jgi:hypothetical protein
MCVDLVHAIPLITFQDKQDDGVSARKRATWRFFLTAHMNTAHVNDDSTSRICRLSVRCTSRPVPSRDARREEEA